MESLIEPIRNVDQEGILSPFMEANAAEFERTEPEVLGHKWVVENRAAGGLGPEIDDALLECARTVRENRALSFLYFHCRRLAYDLVELYPPEKVAKWPSFEPLLPGQSGVFLLLVGLSAVEKTRQRHASLDIPPVVTADTCSDLASRVLISKEFHDGRIGIRNTCVHWLRNHVKGELFQFGRLQFHVVLFNQPFRVYRRIADGEYLMVAEPGLCFNAEGYLDGTDDTLSPEHWWSGWQTRHETVTATAISPKGTAMRDPVTFNPCQWRLILDRTSPVLNTHIPRGPRIRVEDWRESICRGFDFFSATRPCSASPVACSSVSWMFDPRLQDLLPADSGLVSLQRRLRLWPIHPRGTRCGLAFIFGSNDVDLESAPQDTTLRRAIIRHLEQGGILTCGGMVVFPDEISRRFAPFAQ